MNYLQKYYSKEERLKDDKISILLIGDTDTGKSSIMERYITGEFDRNITKTIGYNLKSKKNEKNEINIWDFSGNLENKGMISNYLINVDVVILVCDVVKLNSIYNLKYKWYEEVIKKINIISKNIFLYVAINKCDYKEYDNNKKYMLEARSAFKSLSNIKNIFCISALDGHNIQNMFIEIIEDVINCKKKYLFKQNCIVI